MTEEMIDSSMQIILHAGDARMYCTVALKAIEDFDFLKAEENMKLADDSITIAHKIQTDVIQSEAGGEKQEYSILFTHAQDTLMTIYSEINLAKRIMKIMKKVDERICCLERPR